MTERRIAAREQPSEADDLAGPRRVGDVARADTVGFRGMGKMIWSACCTCGRERWVPAQKFGGECRSCSGRRTQPFAARANAKPRPHQADRQRGERNPAWKGGVTMGGSGYRYVLVPPEDPFRVMANRDGYAMEHRLVLARLLGRPLRAGEQVHHINGDRIDNRPANLELWTRSQPSGVRARDYHCPGCRCFESLDG
jgi:hypothetical protein